MNREEFQAFAKKKIDEMYDNIEELERKKDNLSAAAREKFASHIDDLKAKREEVMDKVNGLKDTGSYSWDEMKAAVNESADVFKTHFANIRDKFNQANPVDPSAQPDSSFATE